VVQGWERVVERTLILYFQSYSEHVFFFLALEYYGTGYYQEIIMRTNFFAISNLIILSLKLREFNSNNGRLK